MKTSLPYSVYCNIDYQHSESVADRNYSPAVMSLPSDLEARCRAKKGAQLSKIPKEWTIETPAESVLNVLNLPCEYGTLTADEVEITELDDVGELLSRLAKGVWSAVAVTTAYCKRAIIAHQLVAYTPATSQEENAELTCR